MRSCFADRPAKSLPHRGIAAPPGQDPIDIGKGLNPEPPYLPDVVARWSGGELFWTAKNGIRMSDMPAFARPIKTRRFGKVVAFVQRLPRVTEEDYAKMEYP